MNLLTFDNKIKQQIQGIVDYANLNVYQLDDILDMMNAQMVISGDNPKNLILFPVGRWACYYLVDHPNRGRCHYFQI